MRTARSRNVIAAALFGAVLTCAAGALAQQPSQQSHYFTIVNNGPHEIFGVYIIQAGSGDWGDDWLGRGKTIPAGRSQRFTVPGRCVRDVEVIFGDGREIPNYSWDTCTNSLTFNY